MKAIILAVAIVLCACSTTHNSQKTTNAMNSWINHPETELLEKWGAPTQTVSNGANGKILVYDKKALQYLVVDNREYTKSYQFYVNSEGKIYKWLTAAK